MNSIAFWKYWGKPFQNLFWLLASLLLVSIASFWYSYYANPAPVITWDQFQQLTTEEIPIKTFSQGIFEIPVYGENYLIYEILGGSELQPNTSASYLFLVVFSISFVLLLSVVSSLRRAWFITGMGIFCLIIMTLRLDALQVFDATNKIFPIFTVLLFCLLSYYFHSIRTDKSLIFRFLSFGGLYGLLLTIASVFSTIQNPLLHVSVNGFMLGVPLSIIFILMVAHEIPAAFITVITQGKRSAKSLQHFLIITGFYLVNLLIAYGIKIGYINLNIWTIDFYLLFTISATLGIWGFRHREPQYESILPAGPTGTYFILGMASMCFGTISYFMATANDTILIVLKDLIIYSHLGYGIIFLFYVIANFGSMLTKNLQVYKVLYKPTTMPYFTFRLMGLICTFGFLVFDTNWRTPVYQIFASYQNSYGDLYLSEGNLEAAEVYYDKSVLFRNQNHHAHYALAGIQSARLEPGKELEEWKAAGNSFPTPQTIINLSDAYWRRGKNSDALFALERVNKRLANNEALLNARGLMFSQLNMADSALQAFQQARKSNFLKEIAETNLLAASVRFKISYPADSLLLLLGSDKEGPKSNALALANMQSTPIQLEFKIGKDSVLSAIKAAFICNYFINQRNTADTALLNEAILLARRPVNVAFKEHLLIASAQAYYAQGMVKRAFELTREVAYRKGQGKYFLLLGQWALEQGNPEIAANYFAIAKEKQLPAALFDEALAQTESKNFTEAVILWDSLTLLPDSSYSNPATKISRFLKMNSFSLTSDDKTKYLFCRYRISLEDSSKFINIVNSISNQELKARALIEYSKRWYERDEKEIAAHYLSLLDGLTPTRESTLSEFYYLHCMLLADSKNWEELNKQIHSVKLLKKYFHNEIIYWQALLDDQEGRKEEAKKKFEYLGNANMYFEDGIVAASQFLARDTTVDRLKTYSMLVEGLMVRPNSVKLLKAYIKEAAVLGFDDEAAESLNKLQAILPRSSFNRYVKDNPDYFDVE